MMYKTIFKTPLGNMVALADDHALHFFDFEHRYSPPQNLEINFNRNKILTQLSDELEAYFTGDLKKFETPLRLTGTDFQRQTWEALMAIPYGETWSYQDQAVKIKNPKAFRAVANANGQNKFAIIIPCHRVIRGNNALGGYGGGIDKKEWLLKHERKFKNA